MARLAVGRPAGRAARDGRPGGAARAAPVAVPLPAGSRPDPRRGADAGGPARSDRARARPGQRRRAAARARAGYRGDAPRLHALVSGEPATWLGHTEPGPGRSWSWDLTRLNLQPFAGITSGEQYLEQLQALVGLPLAAPPAGPALPPLALQDALDHLDLQWRLRTSSRLLRLRRSAAVGVLALPVTSRTELESGCAAFADVLDCLEPGGPAPKTPGAGSLTRLELRLDELLGERAGRARQAVAVLRRVVQVRVGQQHSGRDADKRALAARTALGLPAAADPADDWEQLRHAAVAALRILREEIAGSDTDSEDESSGPTASTGPRQ